MDGTKKRNREDSTEAVEEVKKLRYDIFDTLDDVEVDPTVSDLASVMESFEREIEGEKQPALKDATNWEIGWLLEASDDELGLPPSSSSASGEVKGVEELGLPPCVAEKAVGDDWGFESVEFGCGGGDWPRFDDLFDFDDEDIGFGVVDNF